MSSYLVPVYVIYGSVSVALTIWLARVLTKNGAIFLRDVFEEQPDLAEAVNHLLAVGFYLFNLGYAALILKASPSIGIIAAIETLAWKLGLLLMSLAAMHFVNLFIFHRIRRRAQQATLPPVPPQGWYPQMQSANAAAMNAPAMNAPATASAQASRHSAFDLHEERMGRRREAQPA